MTPGEGMKGRGRVWGRQTRSLWTVICRSQGGKRWMCRREAGSRGCLRIATASPGSASQSPKWGAGGDHSKAFPGRPHCPEQAAVTTAFSQALVETPFNFSPGLQNCIIFTEGTHSFWELFIKIPESWLCQVTQQTPGAAPQQSSFGGKKAGRSEWAGRGDVHRWAAGSPE